jgi:hypothetical protein
VFGWAVIFGKAAVSCGYRKAAMKKLLWEKQKTV